MKILLTITLLFFINGLTAQTQPLVISGRIIMERSSNTQPSITVRSTVSKRATASDSGGLFQISIPTFPDTLVITHIGYETLIVPVSVNTQFLDLHLKPETLSIDEVNVINTGYQTVKPNEINGSVVSIGTEQLNQQSGTNILDRLSNITSGLSFTTGKVQW